MTHVIKIFCFLVAALAAVTNGVPAQGCRKCANIKEKLEKNRLENAEELKRFNAMPGIEGCRYERELDNTRRWRLECIPFKDEHFPFVEKYKDAQVIELWVDNPKQVTFGAGYDKVEEVIVEYSEHTELSLAAFKAFKNLVTLKVRADSLVVDGSLIARIDFTGVGVVESLRNIDLRDNSISEFVGGSFKSSYPYLQRLDLGHNALSEFDFETVPKRLSVLNIESNDIAKLSGLGALKNLNHLNELWARENSLTSFDNSFLPANISKFDSYYNKIKSKCPCKRKQSGTQCPCKRKQSGTEFPCKRKLFET